MGVGCVVVHDVEANSGAAVQRGAGHQLSGGAGSGGGSAGLLFFQEQPDQTPSGSPGTMPECKEFRPERRNHQPISPVSISPRLPSPTGGPAQLARPPPTARQTPNKPRRGIAVPETEIHFHLKWRRTGNLPALRYHRNTPTPPEEFPFTRPRAQQVRQPPPTPRGRSPFSVGPCTIR